MDDRLMATKKKARHPDRVTLTPEHQDKLDGWIKQVTANHRGVRLTRNNIVDWLIGSYPSELPRSDEKALGDRYYDEERFLRAAIRELRTRKAKGESICLIDLLKKSSFARTQPRKIRTMKNQDSNLAATAAIS